jgi:hypothetical protein
VGRRDYQLLALDIFIVAVKVDDGELFTMAEVL